MILSKLKLLVVLVLALSSTGIVSQPQHDAYPSQQLGRNKAAQHPPLLRSNQQTKPPKARFYQGSGNHDDWWNTVSDFQCGQRFMPGQARSEQQTDNSSSHRFIAGGYTVGLYHYPSYLKLSTVRNDGTRSRCGATLISRQFILTATHCVNRGVKRLYVQSTVNRYDEHAPRMYGDVICHLDRGESDVSIVRLRGPVTFSPTLQPACLPDIPLSQTFARAVSVGLGASDITGNTYTWPLRLKAIPLREVPCNFGDQSDVKICLSPSIRRYYGDTCEGDSGGPTYATVNGRQVVYAVTSEGYRDTCHQGAYGYGVYGDVYALKNRILRRMQNCE